MKPFKIAAAAITLVSVLSLSACANGKSHDETAGKTIPAVTDSALGQESSIQESHETDTAPENPGQKIPLPPSEESRSAGPSDIKEPAAIQILSPEEAAVIPEIPEYTYEEACQKGEVRQVRGTLPGAESGTWYIISLDGAEYYYGIYDFNPNAAQLFGCSVTGSEYSLANGISVGMGKDEILARYPAMAMLDTKGNALNDVTGHMGWNPAAYPRSILGTDAEWDYAGGADYHWEDRFDYMLIADVSETPEALPVYLALMMRGDQVAAITFYHPTAG